jgi:inorganic pyrophosphatase
VARYIQRRPQDRIWYVQQDQHFLRSDQDHPADPEHDNNHSPTTAYFMNLTTCIVESPKGSSGKFDFDPETGYFKLHKTLPAGLVFPFDFGFIPGTLGEDGDPLDVIIVSEIVTFPGCAMDCRIIGAITAQQTERDGERMRNDRFIAIPEASVLYGDIRAVSGFPREVMQEIERFFMNYNEQAGKTFRPVKRIQAPKAMKLIDEARKDSKSSSLIELFLPQFDSNSKPFPERYYTAVKKKLTEKFGGVTVHSQSPAQGLWKNDEEHTVSDTLIIFEVMVSEIDTAFWKRYKASLRKTFLQDEIIVRRMKIGLL